MGSGCEVSSVLVVVSSGLVTVEGFSAVSETATGVAGLEPPGRAARAAALRGNGGGTTPAGAPETGRTSTGV